MDEAEGRVAHNVNLRWARRVIVAVSIVAFAAPATFVPVEWVLRFDPTPTPAQTQEIQRIARAVIATQGGPTAANDALDIADGSDMLAMISRRRLRYLRVWLIGAARLADDTWPYTVRTYAQAYAPPEGFPTTVLVPLVHWRIVFAVQFVVLLIGGSAYSALRRWERRA
jgi:hypothetical protein